MMEFPVAWQVGDAKIFLHQIMELLAFFVGFRYYLYLKKKQGDVLSARNRAWVFVGVLLGAYFGSHILGVLESPLDIVMVRDKWQYFANNKTVLGGFLGGLIGVELAKKMIGEKRSSGDLYVFPMVLGLTIGRVGCFSMGIYEETYGLPTHFFMGMDLGDGLLRHPVALYEIAYLALLWAGLSYAQKNIPLQNGALFKLFLADYCLFRFLLDFIKPHFNIVWCLSSIQLAALAGVLYYLPKFWPLDKLIKEDA